MQLPPDQTALFRADYLARRSLIRRTIVFTKDEPGLASRISNDVLPIPPGAGDEEGPL